MKTIKTPYFSLVFYDNGIKYQNGMGGSKLVERWQVAGIIRTWRRGKLPVSVINSL